MRTERTLLGCLLRSFISGHTMVVDGAAWMWKPAVLPRQAVNQTSRSVEGKSRSVGTAEAPRSKL